MEGEEEEEEGAVLVVVAGVAGVVAVVVAAAAAATALGGVALMSRFAAAPLPLLLILPALLLPLSISSPLFDEGEVDEELEAARRRSSEGEGSREERIRKSLGEKDEEHERRERIVTCAARLPGVRSDSAISCARGPSACRAGKQLARAVSARAKE